MKKTIAAEHAPAVAQSLFNLAEAGYRIINPDGVDVTGDILAASRQNTEETE